jgi:putative FmdB family regulatory protein
VPTYDYRCSSCGERVEIVHSINGGPPETCPSCGAFGTLRKAFAPPVIHFKGSGWAKKERHAAAKSRAGKSGESAESGESPSEAVSEAPSSEGGKAEASPATPKGAKGDAGNGATRSPGRGGAPSAEGGDGGKPKAESAGR